jgi:hypothetical protein
VRAFAREHDILLYEVSAKSPAKVSEAFLKLVEQLLKSGLR